MSLFNVLKNPLVWCLLVFCWQCWSLANSRRAWTKVATGCTSCQICATTGSLDFIGWQLNRPLCIYVCIESSTSGHPAGFQSSRKTLPVTKDLAIYLRPPSPLLRVKALSARASYCNSDHRGKWHMHLLAFVGTSELGAIYSQTIRLGHGCSRPCRFSIHQG